MPGYAIFTGAWKKWTAEDIADALHAHIMDDPNFKTEDYEIWMSKKDYFEFRRKYQSFYYPANDVEPPNIPVGKDWAKCEPPYKLSVEFKVFNLNMLIAPVLHEGEFLLVHKDLRPVIDKLMSRAYETGKFDGFYITGQAKRKCNTTEHPIEDKPTEIPGRPLK